MRHPHSPSPELCQPRGSPRPLHTESRRAQAASAHPLQPRSVEELLLASRAASPRTCLGFGTCDSPLLHQRLCRTSLLWARLCLAEDPSVPVNEGLFPKHQARSSSPGETFAWPPWSAQPRGEGLQMLLRGGTAPQGDPPGCLVTGQQTPA